MHRFGILQAISTRTSAERKAAGHALRRALAGNMPRGSAELAAGGV